MAPRRLVTLEWERSGERTHYGRTCASRAIGTTKLRTNQRAHQEQEQQARAALARRYRGVSSERGHGLDVVRPPWAVGISNQQLVRMARDVGQNAGQDLWWERAGLYSGMGELRELLREGGYREEKGRKGTAAARAARELRLEHRGSGRQSASERTRARRTAVASAGGSDLPW